MTTVAHILLALASIVLWAEPALAQETIYNTALAVNGVASPTALTARAGSTASISVTSAPGFAGDWIGLYAAGAADNQYINWLYVNISQTSGTVSFPLPLTPGDYQFRFFVNNTNQRIAMSGIVTAMYDTEFAVNGVVSPAASSAGAGSMVSISITNGPGTTTDWIGLYAAGAPDNSYINWWFMTGTGTAPATGQTSGTVSVPLPVTPGDYEFRFFAHNTLQRVAVSGVVSARYDAVVAVNGVASPTATVARTGSTASISITNGPGFATDWIALSVAGQGDILFVDWRYMNGTRTAPATGQTSGTVSFPLPLTPGGYEFRLFAKDTFQRAAVSGIVTAVSDVDTPAPPAAGTIAYYHTDAIGSVRMVTDATQGAIRYDYMPFGQEYPSEQAGQPWRFAGKERDTDTRFDYFGARYFSADVGRFTKPDDPLNDQDPSNPQSWNLYTYARNNPLKFIDPDGRQIAVSIEVSDQQHELMRAWLHGRAEVFFDGFPMGLAVFDRLAGLIFPRVTPESLMTGLTPGPSMMVVGGAGALATRLAIPRVTDPKLQNYVKALYKGTLGRNPVGNGTTMDAVRNELSTGLSTHGRFHSTKLRDTLRGLTNWLSNNPHASQHDRLVAESLRREIVSTLAGK